MKIGRVGRWSKVGRKVLMGALLDKGREWRNAYSVTGLESPL